MIVYNKSKNRRSFTIGKQRFDLVNGDNSVPESKQMIRFVNFHPDLTIIKDKSEPRPIKDDKKKTKSVKKVIKVKLKEESIKEPKEIDNSNLEE